MEGEHNAVGHPARSAEAGRGLAWWSEAWALFTRQAALWIGLGLTLLVAFIVMAMIPLLGTLVASLLTPVFVGSWMLAARKVEGGGALEWADLFACFKGDRLTPLLVLGGLLVAAMLVIGVVAGVFGAGALFGMMAGASHRSLGGMMAAAGAGMTVLLAVLLLGALVTMALWFAPALVVFRQSQPLDAVRASIGAVLKNMLPFLLYGLVYIGLSIVASIPFGLGWIVLLPVMLLTTYVSYRDLFGE